MALRPDASAGRQRVVVVVDGPRTPAWQAAALDGLRAAGEVEVVGVRVVDGPQASAVERARVALERRLFGVVADALAPGAAIEAVTAPADAELVVWLAEGAPSAAPADAALLRLRHDGRAERLAVAFGHALVGGARTVTTEALLRPAGGAELVVQRTRSGVRTFSSVFAASFAGWKLAALIVRATQGAAGASEAASPDAPPRRPVAPARLLALALIRWVLLTILRVLFRRPWQVEIRRRQPDPAAGWEAGSDLTIPWRPGHLYADPLLFEHDGAHHLFLEAVAPGSPRGVIAHVALDRHGRADGPPRTILEAPHHLSYPYVFAHGGDVFLIPETATARRVELHRAVRFPDQWAFESVLLDDVEAVDATVFDHDGRLWMFVAVAAPGASTLDELHLLWADDPRGPWTPHPANPVVSDATCARPAGAVQEWGGRLIRPGQDGSRRYGEAISFREIDVLTPEAYAEHEIARLTPDEVRGARATHTTTRDGRFEAIDVRRRELRLPRAWTLGRPTRG